MNFQQKNQLSSIHGDFTRVGTKGTEAAKSLAREVLRLQELLELKQEALMPELITLRVACLVMGVSLITVASLGIYHLAIGRVG